MYIQIMLVLFILYSRPVWGASPVFTPDTYSITVGINTTTNTSLATLTVTDDDLDAVTLSTDGSGGASYFGFSGNDLILVNRLDVEYGGITWSFVVIATTNNDTGSATITVTTYRSTTTTTTTPVPPGYQWFDKTENKILFGGFAGVVAILTGFCLMMCLRFHRVGTCLPSGCPAYSQCRGSCKRQCTCCPIPCDFRPKKPKKKPLPPSPPPSPLPEPKPPEFYSLKKEDETLETFVTSYKDKTAPFESLTPFDTDDGDFPAAGFKAPVSTGYGGDRRKRWLVSGTVPTPTPSTPLGSSQGRMNKLTKMAAGGRRTPGLVVPKTASSASYKPFEMGLDEIRSFGTKSSVFGNASTPSRGNGGGAALYPSMLPTQR